MKHFGIWVLAVTMMGLTACQSDAKQEQVATTTKKSTAKTQKPSRKSATSSELVKVTKPFTNPKVYGIKMIGFSESNKALLAEVMNDKTFQLDLTELSDKTKGHTFVTQNHSRANSIIRVKRKEIEGGAGVNFQILGKENRRIINAGDFKLSNDNAITKEEIAKIKGILVRLAYK